MIMTHPFPGVPPNTCSAVVFLVRGLPTQNICGKETGTVQNLFFQVCGVPTQPAHLFHPLSIGELWWLNTPVK